MSEDLKTLIDEQGRLVKQLREENDRLLKDGKNTQHEQNEKLAQLNERLTQIEIQLRRPPIAMPVETVEAKELARMPAPLRRWFSLPSEERKARREAFAQYCRAGLDGLEPEQRQWLTKADPAPGERKALGTSVEFLMTPETVNEIIKGVVEFSPIRQLARLRTTSAVSVKIRKRTGTFAARWVAKTGARTETPGLAYGLEDLPNHELYALVDVFTQDLEDADFNLEDELNIEFAEQFGVAEGASFVAGDAVGEPEGFVTNAAVARVNSGNASLLTADGIVKLFYALKDAYARNGWFVMRRSTIEAVRLLKDAQNQYLWQPGLGGTLPPTLLGRPYVEAVDMPAVAANANSIAFGDFRRGYLIVDRIQISVLRDPFTQAANGAVRFLARKRVGGQVVNAEAIKLQRVAV